MSDEKLMKLLVVGDPGTGKTSVIKRYVHNLFSDHHRSTIGVDFAFKAITVEDVPVQLQLWDIAGQDRFGAIARVYYKGALAALLVFDLSRPDTLSNVLKWKDELDHKVQLPNGKPLPCVLVANKCDLETASPDSYDLDAFCQSNGFIGWMATSAKTGANLDAVVRLAVRGVLKHPDVWRLQAQEQAATSKGTVPMHGAAVRPSSGAGGGCC